MKKSIILFTAMGILLGGCSSNSQEASEETIQSQYSSAFSKVEDCDYYETIYSVYSGTENGTLTRESYTKHYSNDSKAISYNFCFGEGSDNLSEGGYTITEDGKQTAYYSYGADIEYSGSMTITSDSIATPFDVDSWTYDESKSSYKDHKFDLYFYNEDDEMYMEVVTTIEDGMVSEIKNYVSSDDSYEDPYTCAVTTYIYDASGDYDSDLEEVKTLEGQPLSDLEAYLPE